MLDEIGKILMGEGLVREGWANDMREWGERVALYRRYYEGDHRVYLTDVMQKLLQSNEGFQDNYCELVVNTMTDRLQLSGVGSDDEAANDWAGEVMRRNRFDALQLDVHQAVIRDGDTFVLVEYDEAKGAVAVHHEEAFDGVEGMMVVYGRKRREIVAAVKIWHEVEGRRVNVYYVDRVAKYLIRDAEEDSGDGGKLEPIGEDVKWLPGRVPVVHFKNRAGSRDLTGVSEIKAAIPLNDALNRTLVSMVMTSELTAFPLRVAKGFTPPATLEPGMWVTIGAEGIDKDMQVDAFTLEAGGITSLIEQCEMLIDQIGTVTLTPLPSLSGSASASGEALKERKDGLVGKVQRAQTRLGNAWEDMLALASVVHNTFSVSQINSDAMWDARWRDAQVRNDVEVIQNAVAVRDAVGEREFLRLIGGVFGYTDDKIEAIMAERDVEQANSLAALGGNLPGFDMFQVPRPGVN